MLTWHDYTVENAEEIFEQCKLSKAKYWGFKEHPLPLDRMKALFHHMKQCGKTTVLEVVAYTEQEGLEGARIAATCGCDILMGTKFHDSINSYCLEHGIKYMPFVGDVTGRPSVLEGTIDGIIAQAQDFIAKGAYGIDLLGYRFTGDARALNQALVAAVDAPVCLAGRGPADPVSFQEEILVLKQQNEGGKDSDCGIIHLSCSSAEPGETVPAGSSSFLRTKVIGVIMLSY